MMSDQKRRDEEMPRLDRRKSQEESFRESHQLRQLSSHDFDRSSQHEAIISLQEENSSERHIGETPKDQRQIQGVDFDLINKNTSVVSEVRISNLDNYFAEQQMTEATPKNVGSKQEQVSLMRENFGFIRADTEELQQCVDQQQEDATDQITNTGLAAAISLDCLSPQTQLLLQDARQGREQDVAKDYDQTTSDQD